MTAVEDKRLADVNYCSAAGVHRTVRSFLRQQCMRTTPSASLASSVPFLVTNHDRHQSTESSGSRSTLLFLYTIAVVVVGIVRQH
ncbi:hypothetical protein KIN20_038303 [Parelaphostrongylus tenuis]|uniref:Uncharacterized protein n=1 Tax=Parelaphostrongylus tenuis TaxID=148309 RepID=A0AAD5WMV4_PARTN|nr:hypothetical protein KIN20_038303 [Parelaphostrongylus tenuis]